MVVLRGDSFPSRVNPCRIRGIEMGKSMHVKAHNVTIEDVPAIVESAEKLWESVASTIDFAAINDELTIMAECRDADPTRYAQQCLVFAILSPGQRLACNALLVRRFFDAIDAGKQFTSCDDLYQTIAHGIGGRGTGRNIHNLWLSLDAILNLSPDDVTKPTLMAWRKSRYIMGIGEKTAAMVTALYEQTAPVFTIDVHMLRWITSTLFDITAENHTITDLAYRALEAFFVQWSARYFPGQSTFSVQWAVWNVRHGSHKTHLPIFGR
jgi:hypothetical protein